MKNKILVGAGLSACIAAWAAKDPVVMTVNGVDVPRSEFEYLFHKNSRQQLAPQTLDEYAAMFEIYKLKVADAKAAGLDTLESFRKEMAQYRRELAAPYMTDSLFIRSLAEELAKRGTEEVEASHIMFFKTRNADENRNLRSRLDSIRKELLNGADFSEMAIRFSKDPSVKNNKGDLGFIQAGRYPYSFETAVWTLPEGEISEIVESPAGYHLVKPGKRRAARGKVEASHIMTMVRPDAPQEEQDAAKNLIDSLYNVVKANPSVFADVATRYSADKGSARLGGRLPVFGAGEMVPEFESMAFSLAPGEISAPVRTMYGWHIIQKHRALPTPGIEETTQIINRRISNPQDERAQLMKTRQTTLLAAKHKGKLKEDVLSSVVKDAKVNGLDSAFYAKYTQSPMKNQVIVETAGKKFTVGDYLEGATGMNNIPAEMTELILRKAADNFYNAKLIEAEEAWLYDNEADYRNLLNEYHDGTLLYEISLDKVWNKASSDSEGLNKYFNEHRGDYTWTHPRVKGYLVQAVNDTVGAKVRELLGSMPLDSVAGVVKRDFNGTAMVEKILVAKGQNPMVDYLYFGESEPSTQSKFTTVYLYDPRRLDAPEEVDDVKGAVVSDYQNELERDWVNWLRKTYPVKVNKKELKKVR